MSKLTFDHGENALCIAPLMVVIHEILTMIIIKPFHHAQNHSTFGFTLILIFESIQGLELKFKSTKSHYFW